MSTRFHHRFHDGHVAIERGDGTAFISVRYDGRPLSRAALTWGPLLVLQVPERTALAVTTTAGDVRGHDVTIKTTAGDLRPKRIIADSGSIEGVRFTRHAVDRHRRRAALAPHRRRHQRRIRGGGSR